MTEALGHDRSLTIGKVLDELREEFPDITVTKLRYLEDEGLVKPARTPAGYRKYSYDDVDRLRFILACQRDRFWPLKVIRQILDDYDNGAVPDLDSAAVRVPRMETGEDGFPTPEAFAPRTSTVRLSREEVLEAANIDEKLLEEIESFGLIARRPQQTYYDGEALAVASLVGEFAALGLGPRHLRAVKNAAEREVGLFEQVLAPEASRQEAADTAHKLAALSVRLHAQFVKHGLNGFS